MSEQQHTTNHGGNIVWNLDGSHSKLTVTARHMLITNVRGTFAGLTAKVITESDGWHTLKAEAEIDVHSIDTGNKDRDNHLKSEDFFDAENHPKITFRSTKFENVGQDKFKMTGDLTIRGITREETFDVEFTGTVEKDPYGLERAGFELTGSINRFDYGLKWNAVLETGGAVVGPTIKLHADLQFIRQA